MVNTTRSRPGQKANSRKIYANNAVRRTPPPLKNEVFRGKQKNAERVKKNENPRPSLKCIYSSRNEIYRSKDESFNKPQELQGLPQERVSSAYLEITPAVDKRIKKQHKPNLFLCCVKNTEEDEKIMDPKQSNRTSKEFYERMPFGKVHTVCQVHPTTQDFGCQHKAKLPATLEITSRSQHNIMKDLKHSHTKKMKSKARRREKDDNDILVIHTTKMYSDTATGSSNKDQDRWKYPTHDMDNNISDVSSSSSFNVDNVTKRPNKLCGWGELFSHAAVF